jgi:hypothetical protein
MAHRLEGAHTFFLRPNTFIAAFKSPTPPPLEVESLASSEENTPSLGH